MTDLHNYSENVHNYLENVRKEKYISIQCQKLTCFRSNSTADIVNYNVIDFVFLCHAVRKKPLKNASV